MKPAVLVLESGRAFHGYSFGAEDTKAPASSVDGKGRKGAGEVVFNTSMTGYQEILTDPSYAEQIVVMTAPLIGNTGVNPEDWESSRLFCAGLVVREASPIKSNWRSNDTLESYLKEQGIPAIEGVDTRSLTRAIRSGGAMRGGIFIEDKRSVEELVSLVREVPEMTGRDLVPEVTCSKPYSWSKGRFKFSDEDTTALKPRFRVAALDLGMKTNILRGLVDAGCDVEVFPAQSTVKELESFEADGYFLSNGPGDPAASGPLIETVKSLCETGKPIFGICLGHQVLSLALGAKTFKLPFGHHGGNHPVLDIATGKVEITSQNHGFAVEEDSLPKELEITHRNLYDNTVEGFRVRDRPIFGIQYHPEASPGPRDASYLFSVFAEALDKSSR